MTISMDKKYRTRDGREVRIYAVDGFGKNPVHGAFLTEDGWVGYNWAANGSAYPPWYADGSRTDLIEVKPRIQREFWVNVYEYWGRDPVLHETRESADNFTRVIGKMDRLACVKVVIDCEEGEGL